MNRYLHLVNDSIGLLERFEENVTIDFDEVLFHKEAVYANLNIEDVDKVAANIKDFIIVCRFNGVPCDLERDFVLFHDSQYLSCFTYTGNANQYAGTGE